MRYVETPRWRRKHFDSLQPYERCDMADFVGSRHGIRKGSRYTYILHCMTDDEYELLTIMVNLGRLVGA